jgi:hypothetical protein
MKDPLKPSFYRIGAILVFLVAAILFFFRIGQHSLWSDELQTAHVIHQCSQSDLWNPKNPEQFDEYFAYGFLAPYYSATKIWTAIFGNSEAGLRSLSAVSALIALAMILCLGPTVWGFSREASLAAGAVFALSPMMLWYAQEARYYAFLQPVALLGCWFYSQYWKTQSPKWLVGWSLIATFSIMGHSFMIFGIAAVCLYGLLQWYKNSFRNLPWVVACHALPAAFCLLLLEPLVISRARIAVNEPYAMKTDELMPWKVLSNFLCGVYEHPSPHLALLLILIATVVLILYIRASFTPSPEANLSDTKSSTWWIVASVGACFLMITVSMVIPIMVEGKKYVMTFFAPFCLVLGAALTRVNSKYLVPLFFVAMIWNAALVDRSYFRNPQKQNWRHAGLFVQTNAKPGDAWLHQREWRMFAAEYYGGGGKTPVRNILWKTSEVNKLATEPLPIELKEAKRVWFVVTGSIGHTYEARLKESGFRKIWAKELPHGTWFPTELWLFERNSP